MTDLARRALFRRLGEPLAEARSAVRADEAIRRDGCAAGDPAFDYFDSFAACHTLLAEIRPFLGAEIQRLGIDPAGKTEPEIAREIFARQQPPPAAELRGEDGEPGTASGRGESGQDAAPSTHRKGEP